MSRRQHAPPAYDVRRRKLNLEMVFAMTLPPAFSLIDSQFNAFLFASLGEQENGTPISVFSALTRLDLDPWEEAARLSALPVGTATQLLAPMIAQALGGRRDLADIRKIAARVVKLLPRHGDAGGVRGGTMNRAAVLLICLGIATAALFGKIATEDAPADMGASVPGYATRSVQD